jgi:hypothetical protein
MKIPNEILEGYRRRLASARVSFVLALEIAE